MLDGDFDPNEIRLSMPMIAGAAVLALGPLVCLLVFLISR